MSPTMQVFPVNSITLDVSYNASVPREFYYFRCLLTIQVFPVNSIGQLPAEAAHAGKLPIVLSGRGASGPTLTALRRI